MTQQANDSAYKPSVISFDYETSGLNYWELSFKVISAAFAWRQKDGSIKTKVTFDELDTFEFLFQIYNSNIPLVCHNAAFELGVTQYRFFFAIDDLIKYDTMRLVQVYDNGGEEGRFGLVASTERILPDEPNHKQEAYDWIRANCGAKPGHEGSFISELPRDILERYNAGDAVVTLKLFEKLTSEFFKIGYAWQLDHSLYMNLVKHIVSSKAKGIAVERNKLEQTRIALEQDIAKIDTHFRDYFSDHIKAVEYDQRISWVNELKTENGKKKRTESKREFKFNPKSTKHLKELFVDMLSIEPTFTTPKGKPSFKSSHLHTYGDGGKLLAKRNKLLLVLQQTKSLLELSERDGRWHSDLRAVGTKTGRNAGGSNG